MAQDGQGGVSGHQLALPLREAGSAGKVGTSAVFFRGMFGPKPAGFWSTLCRRHCCLDGASMHRVERSS
jgi:hypothetical protein